MANRRVLVKRRKATRNIRKITRTMQLIATARFQAAYNRTVSGKPYTEKLTELANRLASAAGGIDHPLTRVSEEVERAGLVILTSNRGLCGGYNTSVLRVASERIAELESQGHGVDVFMVGKKGIAYFRFVGRAMTEQMTHISDLPRYEEVEPIASRLMERFVAGDLGSVEVAFMKFVSAGRQIAVVEPVLPLRHTVDEENTSRPAAEVDYEYSPAPGELLDELLPATVRIHFYQCFGDASVSEQVARMVAMKAATDAADDMIKGLTQKYNRARQTAITMELLDIVGGANALA